MTKLWD